LPRTRLMRSSICAKACALYSTTPLVWLAGSCPRALASRSTASR
jgi:hypothetical protein